MRTFRAQGNVSSAGGGAEGQELAAFVPGYKSGMVIRLAPFSCLCANLSGATIRGIFPISVQIPASEALGREGRRSPDQNRLHPRVASPADRDGHFSGLSPIRPSRWMHSDSLGSRGGIGTPRP